ncbi:MAG TPA: hypothetical protein VG452_10385 [Egibacteraceae bacterium]|nr:hypothetical protein [Egibacteraceae bacterium]
MAHPRLARLAGFDRTLLTAGAVAVLVTAPLAASAGAEALDTGGGGGVPVIGDSAVQEASAPAAPAEPAARQAVEPAAPTGQAASDPAAAPVVEAPAVQPPADAEPADAEGPIDDVTEAAQQAVATVQESAAAAQEAVAGVVGNAPVQPPPGAPLPGGPDQPQDPGPDTQPANPSPAPGTVRTVTGASSTVTPAAGPVATLPVAPAGGLSAFVGPDCTASAELGGGFGSGSGPLLQPFAAPGVSVPFITDVPQIARDAFTDTGSAASGEGSTAATPFDGVVPANAPAWLLTTAAGLLLLVGAGHVLRAKAQPTKS